MCDQSREYNNLSDNELLKLLLPEDTIDYLMQKYTNLEDILLKSYIQVLEQVKGIDNRTCNRIKIVSEIAYRLLKNKK